MPEVKHFIYESVLKEEYKGLSVQFIPGANPELVMYKRQAGGEAEEVSREALQDLTGDQLHELVQQRGFTRVPVVPEQQEQPPGPDDSAAEAEGVTFYDRPYEEEAGGHGEL